MKLAILALAAAFAAAATAPKQEAPRPQPSLDRMNAHRTPTHCIPVEMQVAGTDRRRNGTRLDQQPEGRTLLAVDRQVNGCREVTLVDGARRR